MINIPPSIPLPSPERARWQPLRLGLVELYHYDVEEFWFRDGHLLLRGNNGTGKSKVLSLTLPFLLDANLSASRVEPDGDRGKRMEWNLLMNKRHERRIGYTWIEFGRRDSAGQVLTLTLGCGLRAVAGRPGAEPWFFITEQRIGADLWLTTPEKTALSRERLIEAVGARGQVFPNAQSYRRAVDERLFRLGTERYDALVDTLIQLRQPQLSKNPDEERLSEALTHALRPLDRGALEDVADAMSELDDIRRDLEEIEAMRKAIGAFGARYRRYAQIATRRRARILRQAQTDFDNASRDVNAAQAELDEARARVARHQSNQQNLDEQLAADDARLRVLRSDPVMRDAARLSAARERVAECRVLLNDAAERKTSADTQLAREEEAANRRCKQAEATRSQLLDSASSASRLAKQTGLGDGNARALQGISLPDGATEFPADTVAALLREGRESESRRRDQIGVIRRRLREVETALQIRSRAQDARALHADAFGSASEAARSAAERLQEGSAQLLSAWRLYRNAAQALQIPDFEAILDELETWHETLSGVNPMRAALDRVRHLLEQNFAAREARIAEERRGLTLEQRELQAERGRLEAGEDQEPPVPYTRDATIRSRATGAPLWQLVDFASHISSTAHAGLEAALEASGLLDAWVLPEGALIDGRTNDVILTVRAPCTHSLADWLIPTIPAAGGGAQIEAQTLSALLRSVACAEYEPAEAETWVSPSGEFRLGNARGTWMKSGAQYIGHAAREASRKSRLTDIATRLGELDAALGDRVSAAAQVAALRDDARSEYERAPADDGLLRLHAEHNAAEQQRRDAQARLGEAESKLAQAENALSRARDDLALDARDLNLPATAADIDLIEQTLGDYRMAVTELANAVRDHRAALAELAEQTLREQQARDSLASTIDDHREKQKLLGAAAETVTTLQATVGKQVDELLSEIEATERAQQKHERALKDARAQLVVAATLRGTAEQKHSDLNEKLEERSQARKTATEKLQAYTLQTGFVDIAVPDLTLPEGTAPWGIDAALTIARRAEQALSDVPAEEPDWDRIQREIGRDFTELQSTMSTQGHSATAEPSDHGLIVRIVFQQRPERPDALEQRLETELGEQRLILSAQERALLEEHLEKEIAANLQRMIRDTEERVTAINTELDKRPTSTGMRYRLVWEPLPENDENAVPGLGVARKRLLNTSADAWSVQDRRHVGEFLQARIDAERQRDERGTLFESLTRALDYRRWHHFTVERNQDGQWKPLSGPASSGERALGLTVPLFAAASSHYESSDAHAPRLVLLDEAFAGIDDEARASCMGLIREFDLDFVMTSEREWGCYAEIPGLNICWLVRREGMDAVFVSRWSWDGHERRTEEDPVRRFPEPLYADE
ncbi:MAG TPA: TIGR02680 family protein [Gemmatimonadaceae bacterium]